MVGCVAGSVGAKRKEGPIGRWRFFLYRAAANQCSTRDVIGVWLHTFHPLEGEIFVWLSCGWEIWTVISFSKPVPFFTAHNNKLGKCQQYPTHRICATKHYLFTATSSAFTVTGHARKTAPSGCATTFSLDYEQNSGNLWRLKK